jgi:hypothetical protein
LTDARTGQGRCGGIAAAGLTMRALLGVLLRPPRGALMLMETETCPIA